MAKDIRFLPIEKKEPMEDYEDFEPEDFEEILSLKTKKGTKKGYYLYIAS